MKKSIMFLTVAALAISGCSDKTKNATSKFITNSVSSYKIDKTVEIVKKTLAAKNYQLISSYDHNKNANELKEMLYPAYTITFNNPKITTKLLQCSPTLSVDLPFKIGIYNTITGETHVAYTDSEYWSLKHNVKDSKCLELLILIKRDLQDIESNITKESK